MENKFTKGKWIVSGEPFYSDGEYSGGFNITTEGRKETITGVPAYSFWGQTFESAKANALLISKSPILFEEHKNEIEFLKIIKRQLGDLGGSMEFEVEERIEFLEKLCFESVNI